MADLYAAALRLSGADVGAWNPDAIVADLGRTIRQISVPLLARAGGRGGAGGETLTITLTGYTCARDRDRALGAVFDAYLTKPIEPADPVRTVLGVVSHARHPR